MQHNLRNRFFLRVCQRLAVAGMMACVMGVAGATGNIRAAAPVGVTPKKVVYRRTGRGLDRSKKSFTITYPIISGTPQARKIQNLLNYEKVFEFNLREAQTDDTWLDEAGYKVNYNNNGLLDVTLTFSGSGAYPDDVVKTIVVNVTTGDRVTPRDAFIKTGALAAKIKLAQQAEVKRAIASIKKENPDIDDAASMFANADFTEAELTEFTLGPKGITFIYDYGFPHAVQALQPEGRYFFTWQAMKPFIKPNGPLAVFQ